MVPSLKVVYRLVAPAYLILIVLLILLATGFVNLFSFFMNSLANHSQRVHHKLRELEFESNMENK